MVLVILYRAQDPSHGDPTNLIRRWYLALLFYVLAHKRRLYKFRQSPYHIRFHIQTGHAGDHRLSMIGPYLYPFSDLCIYRDCLSRTQLLYLLAAAFNPGIWRSALRALFAHQREYALTASFCLPEVQSASRVDYRFSIAHRMSYRNTTVFFIVYLRHLVFFYFLPLKP